MQVVNLHKSPQKRGDFFSAKFSTPRKISLPKFSFASVGIQLETSKTEIIKKLNILCQ